MESRVKTAPGGQRQPDYRPAENWTKLKIAPLIAQRMDKKAALAIKGRR